MDTIELSAGQLLVIDCAARLRVQCGRLWLTRERDATDTVLHAGDEVALGSGRVVVEALAAARLQCLPAEPTAVAARALPALARAAQRVRAHLAAAIVRLQLGPAPCH
ncbi:DUF2917 domain-containing protein [Calidifontimicrobium sp. SYSU G02091]|uniref:DUF2917 domain-containing protein n=1 Tax=Calidifontimicrobium sp. SYSU G02091 TaxID=2926421 RepID=UPI001F53652F|nr:DUF2917 domain-containing protein [Calidifontimicrobium sp. SYSU G02091]MCI1191810.1 DUF2917 domain-containing protein [Calidifontimicrobium sp. SYSU G02091]